VREGTPPHLKKHKRSLVARDGRGQRTPHRGGDRAAAEADPPL